MVEDCRPTDKNLQVLDKAEGRSPLVPPPPGGATPISYFYFDLHLYIPLCRYLTYQGPPLVTTKQLNCTSTRRTRTDLSVDQFCQINPENGPCKSNNACLQTVKLGSAGFGLDDSCAAQGDRERHIIASWLFGSSIACRLTIPTSIAQVGRVDGHTAIKTSPRLWPVAIDPPHGRLPDLADPSQACP